MNGCLGGLLGGRGGGFVVAGVGCGIMPFREGAVALWTWVEFWAWISGC